jgi:hypothetical protein
VVALSLATALILLLLLLLKTPIFRVDSVRVEGLTYIPNDQVSTLLKANVTGRSWIKNFLGFNNMLVWPTRISSSDLRSIPEASSVTIQKSYSRHLILVSVQERKRGGIWCFKGASAPSSTESNGSNCFWFDEQGMISRAPATEGSLVLSINDYSRSGVAQGEAALPASFLSNLFSIFNALNKIDVVPKEIRLNDLALEEVQVPTYTGPNLSFSLRFSANNTPAAFKELALKTDVTKLQYIDFRIENRIYYK